MNEEPPTMIERGVSRQDEILGLRLGGGFRDEGAAHPLRRRRGGTL